MTIQQRMSPEWRLSTSALFIGFVIFFVLYYESFKSIVMIWVHSDTYAHGFLILPITLYLIWNKRQELFACLPHPNPIALLPLIILIVLWLLADLAAIQLVKQLSVVTLIPVLVWLLLGTSVTRLILFPLSYLIFAVPMGDVFIPWLQEFTALFTVKALQLFGIPVFLEGLFFFTPTSSFEVAKACSGIRYLIASVALGVLYAYLTFNSFKKRAVFVALAILVPIIANGLRALVIVLVVHFSNNKIGQGVDHIIYGWLFFGFVMFLLFMLGTRLLKRDMPRSELIAVSGNSDVSASTGILRIYFVWLVSLGIILASGPWMTKMLGAKDTSKFHTEIQLPGSRVPWSGPFNTELDWLPMYIGASAEKSASYRHREARVQLYVANFSEQSQGQELINSQNRLYDSKVWKKTSEQRKTIYFDNHDTMQVNTVLIENRNASLLLWQWYEINGLFTSNSIVMKIYEAMENLKRGSPVPSTIIIASPYQIEKGEAEVVMKDFLETMLDSIRASVSSTSGDR